MEWRGVQRAAFWLAVGAGVLGIGAATGLSPIPIGGAFLAPWLHLPLAAIGVVAGIGTIGRIRELDRERWRLVEDEHITRDERLLAHRETDSQIRTAGATFFLAATALGGWASYQLGGAVALSSELLIITPVLGFLCGLAVGVRLYPQSTPVGR